MSSGYVPKAVRERLVSESNRQCAYCRGSEILTGMPLVVDHITPRALGGKAVLVNLCMSCHRCNQYKGAQTQALDPLTRELTALFNPRLQNWHEHFKWSRNGIEIIGVTACGRATIAALRLNSDEFRASREIWAMLGLHPPLE